MKQDSSHTDKWDILLDLLENPTAYSETQKNEILGDEETLEMYRQIVNVHQLLILKRRMKRSTYLLWMRSGKS